MSNKDYRELQISSSQLVIIFLAIIVLGVIIFLLGISVGKKQSEIVLASQTQTQQSAEPIEQEPAVPLNKPQEKEAQVTPPEQKQQPATKTPAKTETQAANWYIQVGAFQNRDGAQSVADRFEKEGYNAIILNPSSSGGSRFYRVRIGGYASKELAENAKAQMVRRDSKASEYLVLQQR